jgi:hypothetical protein
MNQASTDIKFGCPHPLHYPKKSCSTQKPIRAQETPEDDAPCGAPGVIIKPWHGLENKIW